MSCHGAKKPKSQKLIEQEVDLSMLRSTSFSLSFKVFTGGCQLRVECEGIGNVTLLLKDNQVLLPY